MMNDGKCIQSLSEVHDDGQVNKHWVKAKHSVHNINIVLGGKAFIAENHFSISFPSKLYVRIYMCES